MRPGQQVICIKKDPWISSHGNTPYRTMPKFNEVVTVESYINDKWGERITIIEYPLRRTDAFNVKWFAPLVADAQLHKDLETLLTPVL